jgi:hypothetical protein
MFRRRRQTGELSAPSAADELLAGVEVTAIHLVQADHSYTGHSGEHMQFVGFEVYDAADRYRDPDNSAPALQIQDGVWLARLAGISHHLSPAHFPAMVPLASLILRLEPDNPLDPQAIAVCTEDGIRAGYVPAVVTPDLWPHVARDHGTALITGVYRLDSRPVGVRMLIAVKDIAVHARPRS